MMKLTMRSSLQSRFAAVLLFFAASTCSAADRLVDPTFFVQGQIANSYDPSSNEFDPPVTLSEPSPALLDMAFTVGHTNPYTLASVSKEEITMYSIFTGYEHAYEYYLPDGLDPTPRLINTIQGDHDSNVSSIALSDGGVAAYLASTGGDEIVRIRRNDYDAEPENVLAQPITVLEDSISIPGGVSAMAFEPNIKNTGVLNKLALGRPDGIVEVYQNKNYRDYPLTKAAQFSTNTDSLPVEKIAFDNSYSGSVFWMAVGYALPEGKSGLKLYTKDDYLYVAPQTEHIFEAKIRDFVFSNDNSKLAILLSDGNILVYGSRNFDAYNFDARIAKLQANATALAFHANGEILYVGTSTPARIKTYSTSSWQEVGESAAAQAEDPALEFCDSIHKMIFRPVRSELVSNHGVTVLWKKEENVVHEIALLTSKEDGTVPDLIAVFRVVESSDPPSATTVVPTTVAPTVTTTATTTAAPTTASGAMLPQSKRERTTTALVALVLFGCTI